MNWFPLNSYPTILLEVLVKTTVTFTYTVETERKELQLREVKMYSIKNCTNFFYSTKKRYED